MLVLVSEPSSTFHTAHREPRAPIGHWHDEADILIVGYDGAEV
jgi:hypothetical protein